LPQTIMASINSNMKFGWFCECMMWHDVLHVATTAVPSPFWSGDLFIFVFIYEYWWLFSHIIVLISWYFKVPILQVLSGMKNCCRPRHWSACIHQVAPCSRLKMHLVSVR
jgi:hypothetical protein